MAGQLIQVDTETVTSAVASVTLTGIDSDDVYMVAFNNVASTQDNRPLRFRITKSGTADTTANYDYAAKLFRTDAAFNNVSGTNLTYYELESGVGNATGEEFNGIHYLFNFNNASEYSSVTFENAGFNLNGLFLGKQGGFVHTVASASDGVQFYFDTYDIASGTFTLYKVI
jgi:hypothetical protein